VLDAIFDLTSYLRAVGDEATEGARSGVAHDFFVAGTYVIIVSAMVSLATLFTGFWDWWKGIERDRSRGWLGRAKHSQGGAQSTGTQP
jgi:hypothetical protein